MNILRLKDPMRYGKVYAALATGASVREAAACAGVASKTAWTLRKEIVALFKAHGKTILCGCGGDAGHKGWCRHRFLASPKRQRAPANLHVKQKAKIYMPP